MHKSFQRTMLQILAVLLIVLSTTRAEIETIPSKGLRLDLSALTLNRDIVHVVRNDISKTYASAFKSYTDSRPPASLTLSSLKIVQCSIAEELLNIGSYSYSAPVYEVSGKSGAVSCSISFEYRLQNQSLPDDVGKGTATVAGNRTQIAVSWVKPVPEIRLGTEFHVGSLVMDTESLKDWARGLLQAMFVPDFIQVTKSVLGRAGELLMSPYLKMNSKTKGAEALVFENAMVSMKPSVKAAYFSIAFKTSMQFDVLTKKEFRFVNSQIAPKGDFDYCILGQLIPDAMCIMSKHGQYDSEVDYSIWGLPNNTISVFFPVLPALKERYAGDEQYTIRCQASRFETINDITQLEAKTPALQMQYLTYCYFYAKVSGEYFLLMDVFLRFYYEMKIKAERMYGHINYAQLYLMRTIPELPDRRRELLMTYARNYAASFHDTEIDTPGLAIVPLRAAEVLYEWGYITSEELCIYYKEKRPVNANAQQSLLYPLSIESCVALGQKQESTMRQLTFGNELVQFSYNLYPTQVW